MKILHNIRNTCILIFLYLHIEQTLATPFDDCPSQAFLIQGSSAKIYGVNLATGFYELLSDDMGTTNKLNGMGYNFYDNYLYAFSYEWKSLVKIGKNLQVEPLNITNMPNTTFYVGDIALAENTYYAYRPGSAYGLYKIPLSDNDPAYLDGELITSGSTLNLRIFDFAFHPVNGQLYSVDADGILYSIDPSNGSSIALGDIGESGTFGAVYFDSEGKFYISRNQDGYIFRIDIQSPSPQAELFAFGPSSSNNDGARCATAPILSDVATIDFGSAPESYGSNIENNGARHEYSEGMHLGSTWGGVSDGIEILTNIEVDTSSVINTEVTGEGYINAWADWNQNGQFDDTEHVIIDQMVSSGTNLILFPVPTDAKLGNTWSRIRFSSIHGLGPNGGVSDGEVEDFEISVLDSGVSVHSYPSTGSFSTLVYEDNWPEKGDYDMNDVVVAVRTHRYINSNDEVIRYDIEGKVLALGAGYHNGFAVMLDGITTGSIDASKSFLYINGLQSASTLIESNQENEDAVLVFFEDLKEFLPLSSGCNYYRTQSGCTGFEGVHEASFHASINLIQGIESSQAPNGVLNPFIFATPGIYHGDAFVTPPGRSLEIHLKNKSTSARFNSNFFNLKDDRSIPGTITFVTANYMPWAMEIPKLWSHPKERVDLTEAYPNFQNFVESNGALDSTWYLNNNALPSKIINNEW